jgi:hypothetical protein
VDFRTLRNGIFWEYPAPGNRIRLRFLPYSNPRDLIPTDFPNHGGFAVAEITYLPEVECMVSEGFIPNQVTVGVTDEKGNRQYLRIGKKTITEHGGKTYLPVGIVKLDYRTQRALIELPEEAD